jgi:hypothetical protein
MVTAQSHVRHRNRRILRYLQYGPATPAELSEALGIPIDPSLYRRLKKLRRERAVLTEHGRVYITRRGREMARDGYVPRPRMDRPRAGAGSRSEAPDRRAWIPPHRRIDALVHAIVTARASPNTVQAPKPPAAPPAYPPAPPSLPLTDRPLSRGGQDPSELGGVPVGSGLWLMPDGSYVLRLT